MADTVPDIIPPTLLLSPITLAEDDANKIAQELGGVVDFLRDGIAGLNVDGVQPFDAAALFEAWKYLPRGQGTLLPEPTCLLPGEQ
jgi:hypothetical protein